MQRLKRLTKKVLPYSLVLLFIFLPGWVKYCKLARQRDTNEARLKALLEENMRLAEENRKLKEDPVYIEKMARENLGLAKKDEIVVKFVDTNAKKR
jgi:cell division protein FtsB